ncbi:MAG TPA: DNA ligase D [Phycisphaerae bacterium]|nr:DNA ligase D [Phycisphaerae bacterium]
MGLATYHQKRNFTQTPEPEGKVGPRHEKGLLYVIQKHDASRLHYDFRLELDGTLKSWAVPKGPSLDPARKSLAVQVEDHPVDYGDFEGIIPKGQYGGGTVMLWDTGTWEPVGDPRESLQRGKIHFILHGEKLHGEWALVRMHGKAGGDGKNWLLMKIRDEHAGNRDITIDEPASVKTQRSLKQIAGEQDDVWDSHRGRVPKQKSAGKKPQPQVKAKTKGPAGEPMPTTLAPQLAELTEHPPSGEKWLHEIKFDGYRLLAFIKGGAVALKTRTGEDWTHRFKTLAKSLEDFPAESAILDGEVVVLNEQGQSDFQALQNMFKGKAKRPLHYFVFDLPYLEGKDLRAAPLLERKEQLQKLISKLGVRTVAFSDHVMGDGEKVIEKACAMGSEGIVSKRVDAPYVSRRDPTWLKSKCTHRQEFIIIGFTESEKRDGFKSLLLGYHDAENRLVYAGRAGTGFDQAMLRDLRQRLDPLEQKDPPTDVVPPARERHNARWVKPELVCEVRFTGWTDDGVLRHPAFMGLRLDKPSKEVKLEEPVDTKKAAKEADEEVAATKATARGRKAKAAEATPPVETEMPAGVRITHPDKVLYPDCGVTKNDLVTYYQRVAPLMLPHVAERPLALVRCPAGMASKCFFMRNWSATLPGPIDKVRIKRDETHVMIHDVAGLMSLVQISALEIHTWNCVATDLEHPDQIIFDLDPGPDVAWKQVVKAAQAVREILETIRMPVFLKTSGGKGLHLTVPITPTVDWDQAKAFCKTIADHAAAQSDMFVTNMRKDLRGGKVYIDFHRNGHSATAVAPYGARARAGAPISMPIDWELLPKLKSAADFTVKNVGEHLEARKTDPWKDFAAARVDLAAVAAQTPQSGADGAGNGHAKSTGSRQRSSTTRK